MLVLKHIQKSFGRQTAQEKRVFSDLSLEVHRGDFVSIIGSNGAGKSSLLNMIAGQFEVDSGTILLDGEDITFQCEEERMRKIGYIFQDPMKGSAPHLTIEENIALAYFSSRKEISLFHFISKKDRLFFQQILKELGIGLEDRLNTPVGLLSGGQRQALTLLMASLGNPKLLLLDEPTAALDPEMSEKILLLIKRLVGEKGLTCLMVTHNMKQALELGNRLFMMKEGRIVVNLSKEEKERMAEQDLLIRFQQEMGHLEDRFAMN